MEINTSLNVLAYLIFITVSIVITFVVGNSLHKTGKVFLSNLFDDEIEIMLTINNVLLAGYYLLNIGFVLYTINNWEDIREVYQLIHQTGYHLAIILIVLASIHYVNITALLITAKLRNKFV